VRVLFLNPLSELGGAERCLLDLMASLRETRGDLVLELAVNGPGPLVEEAERLGVRVHLVPMPRAVASLGDSAVGRLAVVGPLRLARDLCMASVGVVTYARRLRRLVRYIAPDVIHSNGIKSHFFAAIASGGIPVVWHIRDLIGLRPVVARALRLAAPRVTAAIAISKLVERDARSVFRKLPVHVVYDAIDTGAFTPGEGNGRWLDTLAGFEPASEDTIRVGLIATYARWKGQDVFIDAISQISESPGGRTVRYYIVGGPIYETRGSQFSVEELRKRAERVGVTHRLGFVPFQRDIVQVFRSLDVVVHASTQPEPFGRTIAEAMACGRAVVIAQESGAAELFKDGSAVLSATRRDVLGLASALCQGIIDDELRNRLASGGRIRAIEMFSRDLIGRRLDKVYTKIACR
jgi:glycosyltransferase involved in cell wall biosynthesis